MVLFVNYPSWISPYVIKGLPIRWYAVMYIVAFAVSYVFYNKYLREDKNLKISKDAAEDFFLICIVGLLLGARIGSCLFYDDAVYYLTHPWMVFWPFQNGQFVGLPGMSYHGGVIGGLIAAYLYLKSHRLPILRLMDSAAVAIPFGYTFGRLGNFFNAELYGRITTSSIGMLFPYAERFSTSFNWVREFADKIGLDYAVGDYINLPRWPSQLFEALFEGVVLGLIMWFILRKLMKKKNWADGTLSGSYIFGYGFFRFFIEYMRQPDADIGYVIAWGAESNNIHVFQSFLNISKGQVFCFLMMVSGAALIILVNFIANRKKKK